MHPDYGIYAEYDQLQPKMMEGAMEQRKITSNIITTNLV
jgi:hypothetical protein